MKRLIVERVIVLKWYKKLLNRYFDNDVDENENNGIDDHETNFNEIEDEKMADITYLAFRTRFRRAGGNARVFGQCGKRHVGDGVLQKESQRLRC